VEEKELSNLEKEVMAGVNRVVLGIEALYSEGKIDRNQADRRISNAKKVGEWLLARKLKEGGEE
jgi:hypothetical protein